MKMVKGLSVLGTFAVALAITFSGMSAKADALSMKITNKILLEHRSNMQSGVTPHQRPVNKALDTRVEGAKTVASAVSLGAPVMNQHPADEVEPARGPRSGHFIPKKNK